MADSLVTNLFIKNSQRVAYETMADHFTFVTQIRQSPRDEISEQATRSWSTNTQNTLLYVQLLLLAKLLFSSHFYLAYCLVYD